jgi:hypothetical protein
VTPTADGVNISTCVLNDCEKLTIPGGIYCPAHLAVAQRSVGGLVEPEVEAAAAAARSEDDQHPGMTKVYDPESGKASWVPTDPGPGVAVIEDVYRNAGQAGQRVGATTPARDLDDSDLAYLSSCVGGAHGPMRKMVAEAMVAGMASALRGL